MDDGVQLVVAQRFSFFHSKFAQTIDRVISRHGWARTGFRPGHGATAIRQYQMFALLYSPENTFSVPPELHHGDRCHGNLPKQG